MLMSGPAARGPAGPPSGTPGEPVKAAMLAVAVLANARPVAANAIDATPIVMARPWGPARGRAPGPAAQDTLSALSSSKKFVSKPRPSVSAPVYLIVTFWPMKDFSE
jgi:hypothetical protein